MIRKEVFDFVLTINFNYNNLADDECDQIAERYIQISHICDTMEPFNEEEALYILDNLGNRTLDDSLNIALGYIIRSKAWPVENIYYREEFSDVMNELKGQLIADGVPYRFSGENDSLGDFSIKNFDEKILKLNSNMNLLDMDYLTSYYLSEGDNLSIEVKEYLGIVIKKAIQNHSFDYNNHYSETTTDALKKLGSIPKNYISTYYDDKNEGYA